MNKKKLKEIQSLLSKLENSTDWIMQSNINLILNSNERKRNT
jgi:hypothetical protein